MMVVFPARRFCRPAFAWSAIALLGFLTAGCAFMAALQPVLPEDERLAVVAAYAEKLSQREGCGQFEADVTVRFHFLLKKAFLSGILLAKGPQSVKFVGLNPLGQPLVVFVLNGSSFLLVDVPSQKAYNGSSRSEKATELFPFEKLERTGLYALLSGVPGPGPPGEATIERNGVGPVSYRMVWRQPTGETDRVVFDAGTGRVQAYELLDETGDVLLRILYRQYSEQECGLPTSIAVTGDEVQGRVELELDAIEMTEDISEEDFRVELPAGIRVETVR